jgi:hypothetical protein
MSAAFPFDQRFVEEAPQVIDMPIRAQNHIATAPAIAAIGSAFWDKLLPAKTHAAAPAVAGLSENFDTIDKHG